MPSGYFPSKEKIHCALKRASREFAVPMPVKMRAASKHKNQGIELPCLTEPSDAGRRTVSSESAVISTMAGALRNKSRGTGSTVRSAIYAVAFLGEIDPHQP